MRQTYLLSLFVLLLFASCGKDDPSADKTPGKLALTYVYIGSTALSAGSSGNNIVLDEPIQIKFDKAVNTVSAEQSIQLLNSANQQIAVTFSYYSGNQLIKLEHDPFDEGATYTLKIGSALTGANDETFTGQNFTFETLVPPLTLTSVAIEGVAVNTQTRIQHIDRKPQLSLTFDAAILKEDLAPYTSFANTSGTAVPFGLTQLDSKTITIETNNSLDGLTKYRLSISTNLGNRIGKSFAGLDLNFYTEVDPTPKFPVVSDDELLTKVQQQTFKYFWDFGHPVSGLARERNSSGETVTSGGSGFGVMAILVGMERGFISRAEGLERLSTIVDFLGKADRFHGAWSHWLNGGTGKAIPFSTKDNGGDLVETSFMAAGLLAARQYLNASDAAENTLITKINELWKTIEWDWYTQGGQKVLYWHWSPDYNWEM
ncbi:MAG: Ig-like domain-containing protein, partial [Mangrovibacterium sp.]